MKQEIAGKNHSVLYEGKRFCRAGKTTRDMMPDRPFKTSVHSEKNESGQGKAAKKANPARRQCLSQGNGSGLTDLSWLVSP